MAGCGLPLTELLVPALMARLGIGTDGPPAEWAAPAADLAEAETVPPTCGARNVIQGGELRFRSGGVWWQGGGVVLGGSSVQPGPPSAMAGSRPGMRS